MTIAYIAGPYRSETEYGVHCNIQAAERAAMKYWKLGYAVICPHKNTAYFGLGEEHDHIWLDGDLEILKRCDVVVMMHGWEKSEGATIEHEVALKNGVKIVYDDGE